MNKKNLLAPRILFVALLIIVTYLTITPNPDDTEAGFEITRWIANLIFGDARFGDKVAHFSAYGALGFTAFFAKPLTSAQNTLTPALLALYGAVLEGAQGLGGVRTPEIADAVANSTGAIAGFAAAFVAARFMQRSRQ